jgi:thiosulfate/3-mercaptopyruvate sulfurtransferase
VNLPPGPLVSTEWLAANLGLVRVVDVRGVVLPPGNDPRYRPKRDAYDAGHLPGAVFVDWTRDIVDLLDPVPAQIAKPEAFASAMGAIGIGEGTRVVVYDDYRTIFAGRLAWALRYHGHDQVRILDGGFPKWVAEGRPVSTLPPKPVAARFVPRVRSSLRRTADEVARELGQVLLVDARVREQFEGKASAASRFGHIPTAVNVPYPDFFAEDGAMRSPEEIVQLFARAGVDARDPRPIVTYCNGGVSCTVIRTALERLGRSDVAVYDGSWNEWGNDPRRPIEK